MKDKSARIAGGIRCLSSEPMAAACALRRASSKRRAAQRRWWCTRQPGTAASLPTLHTSAALSPTLRPCCWRPRDVCERSMLAPLEGAASWLPPARCRDGSCPFGGVAAALLCNRAGPVTIEAAWQPAAACHPMCTCCCICCYVLCSAWLPAHRASTGTILVGRRLDARRVCGVLL